jgi:acetyl esterase/lipase
MRRVYRCVAACAIAVASNPASSAHPVETPPSTNGPAVAFGMREDVEQISLSPDGTKVAYVTPGPGQGTRVVIRSVYGDAPPTVIAQAGGKPDQVGRCNWVSNRRLVCAIYGVLPVEGRKLTFSRQFAIDSDGSNIKQLSFRENERSRGIQVSGGGVIDWLPDEEGSVLMARQYLPDDTTGSRIGSSREGYGVDRIDTQTLAVQTVEGANPLAVEYISDGHGMVRIAGLATIAGASGMQTGVVRYLYRRPDRRGWERLSDYDSQTGEGFNPFAVDRDLNVAYGFLKTDGRDALYSVALDGSGRQTQLFARPDVDIDGLVRIGRRRRVIGASYQTDTRQVEYFDPEMRALAGAMHRALPDKQIIGLVDSSVDERKLLIFAGGDRDPGYYYLLDRDKRDLHIFLPARAMLEGVELSAMKAVSYPAADGTMIPAYLTLPPGRDSAKGLPAIVMPHGGPSARDEWGFDWLAQFFAARGYAVLQPNYRGSEGYGDAFQMENGFRSWRIAVGDVTDAGRWLLKEGADPAKLSIVGWSYGGYAALQSAVIEPGLFKAVVAVAPVTDLATLRDDAINWSNFRVTADFIGRVAPEASPAQNAGRIAAPVLLAHGTVDRNVAYHQSTLMEEKLRGAGKQVELMTFDGLDHSLVDGAARAKLLERADTFIRAATGR